MAEMLIALGAIGVVCIIMLSTIIAIRHRKAGSFLVTIMYGASKHLLQKHLFKWGYILSWGMSLSGLIAGQVVT